MKKYGWLLISIVILICAAAFVVLINECIALSDETIPESKDIAYETQEQQQKEKPVEFTAEYARTGSYIEDNFYPIVNVILSYEDLNEYYAENKDVYHFGRADKSYEDSAIGFLDAYDNYDAAFFEEKALVFVILEEPSGSIRHNVEYVISKNGMMDIGITPIIPEACTDDMAIWHIMVTVDKTVIPESEKDVRIFYNGNEMPREHFKFYIRWNTYGISSYDSLSGAMIKTSDATNPEDYITTCYLPNEQMKNIRNIIEEIDIMSYPDEYNPHGRGVSTPYMTLELSVATESFSKTITVPETVLSFDTDDAKGQRFLNAFSAIIDILTNTNEWRALPDYEFYYD